MDLGIRGRRILVTGGSSGIGAATARAFAEEEGVHVALSYCSNEDGARSVVRTIEEGGGSAMAVRIDFSEHGSITDAVSEVAARWGGIDILVNNAVDWGTRDRRRRLPFEEIPIAQWERMIGGNLLGTVRLTQLVTPFMRAGGWGRIVNVSSDLAEDSMVGSGPYSTLKSALFGFTANLVEELSADGILSNVVLPSWTLTERAMNFFPESFRDDARKAFPTRRITRAEDVAAMILFLCSAANGHVNGERIHVTGRGSQPMLSSMMREYLAAAAT